MEKATFRQEKLKPRDEYEHNSTVTHVIKQLWS